MTRDRACACEWEGDKVVGLCAAHVDYSRQYYEKPDKAKHEAEIKGWAEKVAATEDERNLLAWELFKARRV